MTSNSSTSTLTTCRNLDRSGEIKHAQTPVNCSIQQSHSPQLPISSPSYPVQTFLSSDFDCSKITIVESDKLFNGVSHSKQPPVLQPATNTNLEIGTNECKSAVSFWDLHLPYSTASTFNVQVQERESMGNITIKDLLSQSANNKALVDDENNTQPTLMGNESSCVVLNVPAVNCHQPPLKKQKVSKIDIATKRRKQLRERRHLKMNCIKSKSVSESDTAKIKRERIVFERITTHKGTVTNFGVPVFGFSDSSSSSSCCSSDYESDVADVEAVNVNDAPLVLDFAKEKVQFLKLFGIVTHRKRNAVELSKLERRRWQPNWIPPTEHSSKLVLDLPVPSITASSMGNSLKMHFMHVLGLQTFPADIKYDYEMDWLKVIQDRTKRNCASSLSEYYLKVHEIYVQSIHHSQKYEPTIPMDTHKSENLTQQQFEQNKCDNSSQKSIFQNGATKFLLKDQIKQEPILDSPDPSVMSQDFNPKLVKTEFDFHHFNGNRDSNRSKSYELKQNGFNHSGLTRLNVKNKKKLKKVKEFSICQSMIRNSGKHKSCNVMEESDASHVILKTPYVITNSVNCKDVISRYSQTEPNYVMPLAMILVDNRTISQGALADHVSNSSLKTNMINKGTQCTITQDTPYAKNDQSYAAKNEDTTKWAGLHKFIESYQLHIKDCDAELKSLRESLKKWREAVYVNQCEVRNLEHDRRLLQSTSFMFEQERIQIQTKIDNFNAIVDAFR
ncbi:uncharacterized protein LOC116182860 [Photinus pyralis]|uniref:Genetic suppressor element-like domain-containing protein n=1 Tax=Photinus pyralis TaxID=7054 RepID=A0A1Y1L0J3_PHOPY|nr:uncharacterized protein LOC116182860 [Photinus pyralis]